MGFVVMELIRNLLAVQWVAVSLYRPLHQQEVPEVPVRTNRSLQDRKQRPRPEGNGGSIRVSHSSAINTFVSYVDKIIRFWSNRGLILGAERLI